MERINILSQPSAILLTLILSIIFVIFGIIYYLENRESKRIALGDDYIQAKIYINEGEKDKAKILLEKI